MHSLLLLASMFAVIPLVSSVCSTPPMLWCLHDSIASECGVLEQCKSYNRTVRDKPITLTLFYESMCPGCQQMITKQLPMLTNVYTPGQLQIELVPFGNSEFTANGSIECQHGPQECLYNKYESCAIHFIKSPFAFVRCIELGIEAQKDFNVVKKQCYQAQSVSTSVQKNIETCWSGQLGKELQVQAGKRTHMAKPDEHLWVPWLLVQNRSFMNAQGPLFDNIQVILYDLCFMHVSSEYAKPCVPPASSTNEQIEKCYAK